MLHTCFRPTLEHIPKGRRHRASGPSNTFVKNLPGGQPGGRPGDRPGGRPGGWPASLPGDKSGDGLATDLATAIIDALGETTWRDLATDLESAWRSD